MYSRYGLLLVLAYQVATGVSLPATYDQRQTGDLNVQIHLKDVQILAVLDKELLDDYTEYDYFYDYADFTVKPITKPTTSPTVSAKPTDAPVETTEKNEASETADSLSQNVSVSTAVPEATSVESAEEGTKVEIEDKTTSSPIGSTEEAQNSSVNDTALKTRINDKSGNLFEDYDEASTMKITVELSTERPVQQLARKRCRSGYSPDGKGRCRRMNQRRVSLIPLAMKFAPKFLGSMAYSGKSLAN